MWHPLLAERNPQLLRPGHLQQQLWSGRIVDSILVHNSQDGSYEKHAQLELNVDGRITTQTIQNTKSDDDQGKASTYSINTGVYTEGTTIKWRVRTSGITEAYSEWSATREVNIYAHPTLSVYVRKMDGTALSTLTSFPFYINAIPGPKTQSP